MSTTVDKRIVSMEFDNSKMSDNLKQTEKDLRHFEKSLQLDGAGEGIKNVEQAIQSIDFSGLNTAIDTINDRFSIMGEIANEILHSIVRKALDAGTQLAKALTIKPAMDGLNEYQMQMDAIQTIATNTKSKGTTIDQINAALDDLNTYADKTIFNFSQMVQNIGTFTAAGVGLEDSVTSIKGFMNLAAGVGASNAEAQRAAFQLSQGIAAGVVRLQDWMSIETAQMGGELFQNELLKTAKAFGVYEKAQASIAKEGSFRASLKDNWLSAEIVIETLARMADATTDIGKELTHAATDIRTVSALFDSMGEAMGSPWAQTWRIIIGDLEEAKQIFNLIGHSFENVMNILNGGRNEMLQEWKDLGGREELLKALGNILKFIEQVVYNVNNAFKTFFPNLSANVLYDISEAFRKFTDNLVLTKDTTAKFNKILNLFLIPLGAITRLALQLARGVLSTLGTVLSFIFNALSNVLVTIYPVEVAFWNWLNAAEPLNHVLELFINTLDALGVLWNNIASLARTFWHSFSDAFKRVTGIDIAGTIQGWIDSIKSFFASIFGNADILDEPFEKANKGITGFILNIANGLNSFELFEKVTNAAKTAAEGLGNVFNWIKESKFWTIFETIKNSVVYFVGIVKSKFEELFGKKPDATEELIDDAQEKSDILASIGDKLAGVWDFMVSIWEKIKEIFGPAVKFVGDRLGEMWGNISKNLENVDFGQLFGDILKGGLLGGLIATLWKLFSGVSSVGEAVANLVGSLGDAIENISKARLIDSTAKGIETVANSLLKIVAAIIVISLLDPEVVSDALATLALMVGELAGALGLTGKAMDGFKNDQGDIDIAGTLVIANVIKAFGSAIIKLSLAMALLTLLDQEKLKTGFLVISGLFGELAFFTEWVGRKLGALEQLEGVALAIKAFAAATLKLAISVALLSLLDTEKMLYATLCLVALIGTFGLLVSYMGSKMGMMKELEAVAIVISKFSIALIKISIAILLISAIPVAALIISAGVLITVLGTIILLARELAKENPNKIKNAANTVAELSLAMFILSGAMVLLGTAAGIKGFFVAKSLTKVVTDLAKIQGDAKSAAIAMAIVALACMGMTAALIPFAFLPTPGIFAGALAMIFLMAAFAAFQKQMNPAKVIPIAESMLVFGVALMAMAAALMLLKNFSFADSWQGFAALVVLMALFIVVMYAMQPLAGVIVAVSTGLLMFSGALLLLAVAMGLMTVALPAFALALLAAAPILIAAAGVFILGLLGIFYLLLKEIELILPEIVKVIVLFLVTLAEALLEPLLAFILELLDLLARYVPMIVKLLVDLVLGVIWGLLSGLADWIGPIVDELFRLFINLLIAVNNNLKIYGDIIAEQLTDLFVNILDLAWKTLSKLFSKLASWGIKIGEQIGKGLSSKKVKELKDKLIKPIEDGWNWMKQKVADFINVGKDFIDGLIKGIGDTVKKVTDKLKALGEWVLNTIKGIFGIKSPSKKMAEIGAYLMLGLEKGIGDNARLVYDEISSVGNGMLMGYKSAISEVKKYLDNDNGYDMRIHPVTDFDSIDSNLNDINTYLADSPFNPRYTLGDINTKQLIDISSSNEDVVASIRVLNNDVKELHGAMEGMAILLDGKTLVGQMATPLNRMYGQSINYRRRGKL